MKLVRLLWLDGSLDIRVLWVTVQELSRIFAENEKTARSMMTSAGAAHAVYGVKHYADGSDGLKQARIYIPPVVLSEEEFDKRIQAHLAENPHDLILAVHR